RRSGRRGSGMDNPLSSERATDRKQKGRGYFARPSYKNPFCAWSGDSFPPPPPPREQAAASGDEAGQSSTDDGAGDLNVRLETRRDARIVEIEGNITFGHSHSGNESRGVESRDCKRGCRIRHDEPSKDSRSTCNRLRIKIL